jgi:hypothetical protein
LVIIFENGFLGEFLWGTLLFVCGKIFCVVWVRLACFEHPLTFLGARWLVGGTRFGSYWQHLCCVLLGYIMILRTTAQAYYNARRSTAAIDRCWDDVVTAIDLVLAEVHPGNLGALPPSPANLLWKAYSVGILSRNDYNRIQDTFIL